MDAQFRTAALGHDHFFAVHYSLGKRPLENLGLDGRITLKWFLEK
jgi:hypothetical protein